MPNGIGGGLVGVVPLPFDREQTLNQYTFRVILRGEQLPLAVLAFRRSLRSQAL
ncbi:hypothetical protein GCM10009765_60850 [Fodinicola feengrottensis]|uniref:Uncharacterized protein n=1 Tax=Fodinicola feengrottensis TaxID=435914 RepID=A0ABN2IE81_9ACTN